MRTKVKELKDKIGETVTLYLTLDVLRDQKHLQFILGHDYTGQIQLVVSKKDIINHENVGQMLGGSTFIVTGKAVTASQSKTFGIEIQVSEIKIISIAGCLPITDDSSLDLRFNHRVVDLKTKKSQVMLQVRSTFENACREYLLEHEYTEFHSPKLMGGASESGSQVFKVKYFDTWAFLAQSPQFYKQMAIASGVEGVFEIGPVFRAEESRSSRHLTEFTGLDVEVSWVFDVNEVMTLEEEMLTYSFAKLEKYYDIVKELFDIELPIKPSVKYISLDEAKEILSQHGKTFTSQQDLSDECERLLWEILKVDLIFVYDYPIACRPFYHAFEREKSTTKSFDLIFRGIEITTGAIREHSYIPLVEQASEKGVSIESIDSYLDNFRYGCPPHGGFGLGVERVVTKLLGLSSVKEAAFVPRDPDRLIP